MRFILALGNWYSQWELALEAVPLADELGYSGFVMPDHYMWGPRLANDSTVDTWIALTYLAAKTESIKLGTLVTPIPFRPPAQLAKLVSTLDVISNGRAVLGVGAGWSETEFKGYSEWNDAKIRVDKTKEGLELILKLWDSGKDDKVTFQGKYYKAIEAVLEPKPIQKPHPPLLFGGPGKRMLRLAGRYGDISNIPIRGEEKFPELKDIVLASARKYGREDKIAFSMNPGERREPYDHEQLVKKIEDGLQNGCQYSILRFPLETYVDSVKRFAKEILPSFS